MLVLALWLLFAICPMCILAAKQPHIIAILADDMGFNDVSFRGSNLMPTPNIDALAYSGLILDRHYVLPICTPSRSAFFTGKHPLRLGRQGYPLKAGQRGGIPLGNKLLPEYLKELGYSTHLVGKWHVGYESTDYLPYNRGFDTFLGYYNGYIDYYQLDINQTTHIVGDELFRGFDFHDELGPRWDLQGQYATDIFTEAAVSVIQKHSPDEPLFLCVTHVAAHTGTTDGDGLQAPPGVDPTQRFPYIQSEEKRNYASLIQSLDSSVGAIVGALHDNGLLEDSIILFMSDNGGFTVGTDMQPNYASNWPLRGVKFTLFEGGVRGAAALWSPRLKESGLTDNIMHITDWLPTFVAAAGGSTTDVDGVNQWNGFNGTKDRDLLLNIDEVEDSEALLLQGRWKVVKQNMRDYGNYDFHYRVQLNSAEVPEVTPEQIRKSRVGQILSGLGQFPTDDTITELRKKATINCSPQNLREPGTVSPSTDFFCSEFCVFDVVEDPCELHPMVQEDIIDISKGILNKWYQELIPQEITEVEASANPDLHEGVWVPWLPSKNNRIDSKNYFVYLSLLIACCLPVILKRIL